MANKNDKKLRKGSSQEAVRRVDYAKATNPGRADLCEPLSGLAVRFDAVGAREDDYAWAGPDEACLTPAEFHELNRLRVAVTHRLSGHRLEHSFGVANTARRMAQRYGVDPCLAEAAGLLHDWDKCMPASDLLKKAGRYGIDTKILQNPGARPVLHALTAALSLPELFPELPREVFHAIGVHTSGGVEMSDLDRIIFVADMLEPGRTAPEAIALRDTLGTDSLKTVYMNCLASSLKHVINSGRPLFSAGVEAWNACCAQ